MEIGSRARLRWRRFRIYCLLIGGVFLAAYLTWSIALPYLISLTPFGMHDELQQTAKSPDGRYIAKLLYNDGLTFGYQHITLEAPGWHPFGYGFTDLIKMTSEGANSLNWQDAKTLVVAYDATQYKGSVCKTPFVTKPNGWRDVKIVYQPEK